MSKLADIFLAGGQERAHEIARAFEQDLASDGVVVAMPLPTGRMNGSGHPTAGAMSAPVARDEPPPESGTPTESDKTDKPDKTEVRRSNESEALHRLLVDTRRKFDDLDALKGTLDEMVLPFRGAMRALDEERALSAQLSRQLNDRAVAYDKLRDELQHVENKARWLAAEAENLRETLDRARETGHATENARLLLAEEIKRRDATIAALERQLEEEALQRRGFGENCRALQEQTFQAERRVSELNDTLVEAERRCETLKQDKRALWRAAEQAREGVERLQRRLAEGEGELTAMRTELIKLEGRRAEACAERNRLADAVDELRAQHRAEQQSFNERIEALDARAAAAERQMTEMRRRLIERTEEARAFVCKAAEATMARATAERRLASLQVARGVGGRNDDDPTETRTALSEYLRALNLKSREMALASAAEKMALLGERKEQATPPRRTSHAEADNQVENLVAAFQDERSRPRDIEKTLDAARQADARLAREVADLSGELDTGLDARFRNGAPAALARANGRSAPTQRGALGYEAGLVARLRRPARDDDRGLPVS
jgi:crescentin